MSKAHDLYTEGDLQGAMDAASEVVRSQPADHSTRAFLSELLVFAGDLERADHQMEIVVQQAPERAIDASLFRQLVRAEQARRQFFSEGRPPEVLEGPTPLIRSHLEASVSLRDGNQQEAMKILTAAASQRARLAGLCNDETFEDICDTDDLLAPLFEVLTGNGKYYWIAMDRVSSIEFREPKRLRDLIWRSAHIAVHQGFEGEVYLPVLYVDSHCDEEDHVRLGRITKWQGDDDSIIRGFGQKTYQVGEGEVSILELRSLSTNRPV